MGSLQKGDSHCIIIIPIHVVSSGMALEVRYGGAASEAGHGMHDIHWLTIVQGLHDAVGCM